MSFVRALYPGTFDPVHNGHLDIVFRAAPLFDELVVGIFDHGRPIKKVLFSVEERIALFEENLGELENVRVVRFGKLTVDTAAELDAKVIVRGLRVFSDFEFEFRMAHANQRLNKDIESVMLMAREENTFLSGSTVREIASFNGDISSMVPGNVAVALKGKFGEEENNQ